MEDIYEKYLRLAVYKNLLDVAWLLVGIAAKEHPSEYAGQVIENLHVIRQQVDRAEREAFKPISDTAESYWKE